MDMDASKDYSCFDLKNFLQCRLCSKEITVPKLLPCFHRFCLSCIGSYIKETNVGYKCPECETTFQLGEDGVDGLETDIHSENLKECMQLQSSLDDINQIRECFCCSQESVSSAYCFKCPGFLCNDCRHIHDNNKIAKNHKAFLKVIGEETRSIAVEELLKLKGLPRCETHPSETLRLFCESCDGKTMCVECWLQEHSGHKALNVDEAANDTSVQVSEQMELLRRHIGKISNIAVEMEKTRMEESNTMEEETRQIQLLEEDIKIVEKEIKTEDSKLEVRKRYLKKAERMDIQALKKEMEQKIDKIKAKYEKQFEERKKETEVRIQELEKSRSKEVTERRNELSSKVVAFKESVKEKMEYLESTKKSITKINKFKSRFETFKDTLSCLQRTANTCIIIKVSLAISSEINTLIQELGKEYPRMFSITSVEVETSEKKEEVEMTEQEEATVKITQTGVSGLHLEAMNGLENGNVIIFSRKSYYNRKDPDEYYLIIADIKGEIVIQKTVKELSGSRYLQIYLAALERDKVVMCNYEHVFLLGVKDLSYETKSIQEITSKSSEKGSLSCITSDLKNKRLLLCFQLRVLVIDSELQIQDSFSLSYKIETCNAIAILNDAIFTCDFHGKKAYVLTRKGRFRQKLNNPEITHCQWRPFRICTDLRKYVYILWEGGRNGNIVVQYAQDNTDPLAIRRIDEGFDYFSLLQVDEEEKLVLGKRYTMVLLIYGLQRKVPKSRGGI